MVVVMKMVGAGCNEWLVVAVIMVVIMMVVVDFGDGGSGA